jgi:lysophospholipase L1-like esterase
MPKMLEEPMDVKPASPIGLGKKLFFSISTCLLVFIGIEAAWRTANGWGRDWTDCHRYHDQLGWCLREDWAGESDWTAGYARINHQGLRDDRPVGPKGAGEKRLLVLGDSLTFGGKVRTEETYPSRIEQELAKAGRPWRVLNAGVASYDPSQEGDWLELFGWQLDPDVLAIGFCRNDIEPSQRSTRSGDKAGELPSGKASRWLTEHSIVAYKFQRFLWHQQVSLARALTEKGAKPWLSAEQGGWPFVESAYRRIAASARRHRTPVLLIIFPTLPLLQGDAEDDLSERLQALGQELGWRVIDVADTLRDHPATLFCEGDSIHPNAAGYARVGLRLSRELIDSDQSR